MQVFKLTRALARMHPRRSCHTAAALSERSEEPAPHSGPTTRLFVFSGCVLPLVSAVVGITIAEIAFDVDAGLGWLLLIGFPAAIGWMLTVVACLVSPSGRRNLVSLPLGAAFVATLPAWAYFGLIAVLFLLFEDELFGVWGPTLT